MMVYEQLEHYVLGCWEGSQKHEVVCVCPSHQTACQVASLLASHPDMKNKLNPERPFDLFEVIIGKDMYERSGTFFTPDRPEGYEIGWGQDSQHKKKEGGPE